MTECTLNALAFLFNTVENHDSLAQAFIKQVISFFQAFDEG